VIDMVANTSRAVLVGAALIAATACLPEPVDGDCDGGACADAADAGAFDRGAADSAVPGKPTKVLFVIFQEIRTCIVGAPCVTDCIDIQRSDESVVQRFALDDNFKAVLPAAASSTVDHFCLDLLLDQDQQNTAASAAVLYGRQVAADTRRQLLPDLDIVFVPAIELPLSRWSNGLWLASWDVETVVRPLMTSDVDAVIAVHGVLDVAQDIRVPIPACGGTFGADYGVGGAGYSWIPDTAGYWFQCLGSQTFVHEWLHQVDWAYENIMDVVDIYSAGYPACDAGDPDPHRWFPSSDSCTSDPDWHDCGHTDCPNGATWNTHLLGVHYDPARTFIGNACRDGKQDLGETGVDVGGKCP